MKFISDLEILEIAKKLTGAKDFVYRGGELYVIEGEGQLGLVKTSTVRNVLTGVYQKISRVNDNSTGTFYLGVKSVIAENSTADVVAIEVFESYAVIAVSTVACTDVDSVFDGLVTIGI
jgi:hypothetical protein